MYWCQKVSFDPFASLAKIQLCLHATDWEQWSSIKGCLPWTFTVQHNKAQRWESFYIISPLTYLAVSSNQLVIRASHIPGRVSVWTPSLYHILESHPRIWNSLCILCTSVFVVEDKLCADILYTAPCWWPSKAIFFTFLGFFLQVITNSLENWWLQCQHHTHHFASTGVNPLCLLAQTWNYSTDTSIFLPRNYGASTKLSHCTESVPEHVGKVQRGALSVNTRRPDAENTAVLRLKFRNTQPTRREGNPAESTHRLQ